MSEMNKKVSELESKNAALFVALKRIVECDWNPIETAPKTGIFFVIGKEWNYPAIVTWDCFDRLVELPSFSNERLQTPTHWRPMFEPLTSFSKFQRLETSD